MIIYFADRQMNILGQASTNLPQGNLIINDLKSEDVETGVASFECELPYTPKTKAEIRTCAAVGNYILCKNGEEAEAYTIIDVEHDTKSETLSVYAEDAGLDLLNEVVGDYTADKAYPIAFYIEKFTRDSGFEIGLNELPQLTRKLKWQGDQTVTERIADVAAQFEGAEISYRFEIEGLTVVHKYINIYASRGKDIEAELRMDTDIDRIVAKESIRDLATALIATGATPEGKDKPVTLAGYSYDDGDFYVSGGGLYSRKALDRWGRYIGTIKKSQSGSHIVRTYSCNATSQKALLTQTLAELKRCCEVEVNYEVDIAKLPLNVRIGDVVNIVDSNNELYLSARILKLESSVANDTHEATLGNYLIKGSGVSQRLTEMAERLKELSEERKYYTWVAYADDAEGAGISLSPEGKRYMGIAANRYDSEVDLSDPSVFDWMETKGEPGEKGEPGQDGKESVMIGKEPPKDTSCLWCDISETVAVLRRWDGETWSIVNDMEKEIELINKNLATAIESANETILMYIDGKFYTMEEVDKALGGIKDTQIELDDRLTLEFSAVQERVEEVSENTQQEFQKIKKYITFEEGGITIGIEGNPLTLRMRNDRIAFYEGEDEVAYINNRKMYIRDEEILGSLKMGDFAYIPRNNGNLSFKKVR